MEVRVEASRRRPNLIVYAQLKEGCFFLEEGCLVEGLREKLSK